MTRIHLFAVTAILFIGVGCSGSPDGAGAKPVDTGPASPAGPAAAAAASHPDPAVAAATSIASEAAARLAETLS